MLSYFKKYESIEILENLKNIIWKVCSFYSQIYTSFEDRSGSFWERMSDPLPFRTLWLATHLAPTKILREKIRLSLR